MKPHATNNVQTLNKAKLIPTDPKTALIPYLYSGPAHANLHEMQKFLAQYYFRICPILN